MWTRHIPVRQPNRADAGREGRPWFAAEQGHRFSIDRDDTLPRIGRFVLGWDSPPAASYDVRRVPLDDQGDDRRPGAVMARPGRTD
jgi:hypothetical protein